MSIASSNRRTEYQKQQSIVQRADGSLTFAPINRVALTLPPELTSMIFFHCLPEAEFIEPNTSAAPLVLLRICRQWRYIALSTPALWASLYIDLNRFGLPQQGFDDLICDWLSRSGDMPLSIQLHDDYCCFDSPVDEDQLQEVLAMIGGLSARWQTIWFSVFPHDLDDLFPVGANFRRLQKLSMESRCDFTGYNDFPEYPPYELKDAHSLREIQLYSAPWPKLTVPWASLRIYGSEKINVSESVDILRKGTSLSQCTLSLIHSVYKTPIPSHPPITNIRDLTLSERADGTEPLLVMDLLRCLTLPALEHLALKFRDPEDRPPADVTEFIFFASRSSLRQLQVLTLCLMPASETGLLQCLECTQSITTLQLQLPTSMAAVLDRLARDPVFLPRLESFHIVNFSPCYSEIDPEVYRGPGAENIIEMISSRWYAPAGRSVQLRSFRFDHSGTDAMNLFTAKVISDPTYQLLEEAGMNLTIGKIPRFSDSMWYVDW
ncbi:hypothetical protein B0H11DRAFT_2006299 [Mycena galericulata]|nr:hypothetical protein B0H11DRAFT_2006299 [Mycena galericulata]